MTDSRPRLVVLFGGQSAEHDVSCVSARHVIAATNPARYDIRPVAITRDGRWLDAVEVARVIRDDPENLPPALPVTGPEIDPFDALRGDTSPELIVFPLLHGPMGEDGTVQGLLEVAGVPYVGCGVLASAVAMDKAMTKGVLAHHGIPQTEWVTLDASELADGGPGTDPSRAIQRSAVERIYDVLGFPMFVKPANMGSSIGISKAHNSDELLRALHEALTYDEFVICEKAVNGREIECAVLGNSQPRASLPGEIIPGAEFYDYEDKYSSGTAQLRIPADLPTTISERIQTLAVETFTALRCEGMARIDFFYEPDGRGLLVNEVNTIPGFTPISMYPRMWQATGLAYGDLIDELIRLALERHQRRTNRRVN